jgi:N-acetylmuramidase-like protein/putative peptidoglycan binding protein
MPSLDFQGTAWALSMEGLSNVAAMLAVHAPEVWSVLAVETSGCGFLPDRRPEILYERHVFHRLTQGQYDDGDISDPTPGGYGARGAHQYERLVKALASDRLAALRSTSWGIGQIMGENFKSAGFADVESMVAGMSESEDKQLAAMGSFLIATKLNLPLRAHDWASFARGYNGPNYATNQYDSRLNGEYLNYSGAGSPDLLVRAVQLYLTYLNFHPGPIDGVAGAHTLAALAEFQNQHSLAETGFVDENALSQLVAALPTISSGTPTG